MVANRISLLLGFFLPYVIAAMPMVADDVVIKGSDTMLVMDQRLAEEYMKRFPGTNIQVSGGGSAVGIAALHDNTTDIAACSRLLRPIELQDFLIDAGMRPVCYNAALDGIAIFVNVDNPINELTVDQLAKIFRGDYDNWKDLGGPKMPINVYSRDNTSGTYAFIKEEILNGDDYTPHAQTLPGTAAVYDAVAKDTRGIGYGGIGYNKGVKLLKLKKDANSPGLLPTEASVYDQSYPLARTLNFYLNPRSTNDEAVKFIQWVRSPEGQKVVVSSNYFALPEMLKYTVDVKATDEMGRSPASSHSNPLPTSPPVAVGPVPTSAAPSTPSVVTSGPVIKITAQPPSAPDLSSPQADNAASPSTSTNAPPVLSDEQSLAQREAQLSDSENKLAQAEEDLVRRAAELDAREAKLAQREADLNRREAELNNRAADPAPGK